MDDNVLGNVSVICLYFFLHTWLGKWFKMKWWRTMQVTKRTYSLSQNQAMELDAP